MATKRFERPTLPPETAPDYQEKLIDACVVVYQRFQNDRYTLDYMGIKGKMRPIVLKNEVYLRKTRMMKAELYLDEIEDVEEMIDALEKEEETVNKAYNIREKGQELSKAELTALAKDDKDRFAQLIKLKDRRMELRSMSRQEENEEVNVLNIAFIALTKEEFEQMQNVEIHEGSDDADGGLVAEKKDELVVARREAAAQEDNNPFRVDSEGNLIGRGVTGEATPS